MSEALGRPSSGGLTRAGGHLKAEFGYGTLTEIGDLLRALAVACVQMQARRVLVVANNDDPENERSLRDALTTMVLAGIPADFKLGLVASAVEVREAYRNVERDATAVGIATKVFPNEEAALAWLKGKA